jgi:hypothetical protein
LLVGKLAASLLRCCCLISAGDLFSGVHAFFPFSPPWGFLPAYRSGGVDLVSAKRKLIYSFQNIFPHCISILVWLRFGGKLPFFLSVASVFFLCTFHYLDSLD